MDGLFVVEADVLVGEEVVAESWRVCEGLEDAVHETGVAFVSFLIWEFNKTNSSKEFVSFSIPMLKDAKIICQFVSF